MGRDVGGTFAVSAECFLTAAHVVGSSAARDIEVAWLTGQLAVERIEVPPNGDLAIVYVNGRLDPCRLATSAVGDPWHVTGGPPEQPHLTGTIDALARDHENHMGIPMKVMQLSVTQVLGRYDGYSGAGVLDRDGAVVGMLVEEAPERWGDGSFSKRAANVLYALPSAALAYGTGHDLSAESVDDVTTRQIEISSDFWSGRFSASSVRSENLLQASMKIGDHDSAILALANLILITRSRDPSLGVDRLLESSVATRVISHASDAHRFRFLKEMFIYYHELGQLDLAARYLGRMEAIDPNLMIHTPGDDWIPGTLRWRKALLEWTLNPSGGQMRRSLAIAHEGIDYLVDRLRHNPRHAGLASAYNNTAWLYFMASNPLARDYFSEAVRLAGDEGPRITLEALVGLAVTDEATFGRRGDETRALVSNIFHHAQASGFVIRNYSFLANEPELDAIITPARTAARDDPASNEAVAGRVDDPISSVHQELVTERINRGP